ncbi:inactive N-acetylated-alpha-linked acidic dipeptidase-like protein 2 [Ambystoma mexicanum]|uniref:inactive N-acetylated-alpha-linked acidic dipeptidase-like protein 2 n=1 Tax=Ambystoma mexicanum TaxID=8296 RepID=UPI0037E99F00
MGHSAMAFQEINSDHRVPACSPYLDNEDLQPTNLELEWDMETVLEEHGLEHFDGGDCDQHEGNAQGTEFDFEYFHPSVSPKGRFQRLDEDLSYISRYKTPVAHNNQNYLWLKFKLFCIAILGFITGILIGHYARKDGLCPSQTIPGTFPSFPSPSQTYSYEELLKEVNKESIEAHFRYFAQLATNENETGFGKILADQWTSFGLNEVQLTNYSVSIDVPGSSPNTVTLRSSGQCFYPSGEECNEHSEHHHSPDHLHSFAAYSAKGTLEAEVIDVQYGNVDDLKMAKSTTNVTNKIALLKLGYLPLAYKLYLLEDAGFGGVLAYADSCDLQNVHDQSKMSFWVSLNRGRCSHSPGGDSGSDTNCKQNESNFTSMLVQPISESLVKKLFSLPEDPASGSGCRRIQVLQMETVILQVQTVPANKTITNVVGYLKGTTFPDRYVIVGSHHKGLFSFGSLTWASSAATITTLIQALMMKTKQGWRPQRTIIFCSWDGTAFGSIGSHEWAKDLSIVLQGNAVAYISLHNPVKGNTTIYPVASPSLQQLAAEGKTFNCTKRVKCYGSNVSSVQVQGDADFFINHLGIPFLQFVYEDLESLKGPGFLSDCVFPRNMKSVEEIDRFFNLHETIAKITGEAVLKIACEPVLPFNALEIAIEIQNKLQGTNAVTDEFLAKARGLSDIVQLFQSYMMRPANDPKERDPIRVRMLNDVLHNMEKMFVIQRAPPGVYRNILYSLDENSSRFAVLQEALEFGKLRQSNETFQGALSMVLQSINSAQHFFKAGLDVFENVLDKKN